jgi:hypothetical protein
LGVSDANPHHTIEVPIMSTPSPSLRELAIEVARAHNIPLDAAQLEVTAAARRASVASSPSAPLAPPGVVPGSPEHLRELTRGLRPASSAAPSAGASRAGATPPPIAGPNVAGLTKLIMEQHGIDPARAQQIAIGVAKKARELRDATRDPLAAATSLDEQLASIIHAPGGGKQPVRIRLAELARKLVEQTPGLELAAAQQRVAAAAKRLGLEAEEAQ